MKSWKRHTQSICSINSASYTLWDLCQYEEMESLLGVFIDRIRTVDWRLDAMKAQCLSSESVALGDNLSGG